MKSWHEFLTMGGYAAYVWPAYGIAALVLILQCVTPPSAPAPAVA